MVNESYASVPLSVQYVQVQSVCQSRHSVNQPVRISAVPLGYLSLSCTVSGTVTEFPLLTSGNDSSCLMRQSDWLTRHGLHFTHFNPSSPTVAVVHSPYLCVSPQPPLHLFALGLSPPPPLFPLDYIFHLRSKITSNCSLREFLSVCACVCVCVSVCVCVFVCVRVCVCFNRIEMGQLEAVDLVGKEMGTERPKEKTTCAYIIFHHQSLMVSIPMLPSVHLNEVH